jgi:lipopolysaccharide assembly protein A
MQFLRTVFWVVLAVIGAVFALNNWVPVTIKLWSDIVVDTPLPFLMFLCFLVGLLPPLLLHRITRWSLNRKLENANRSLVETRVAHEAGAITRADPSAATSA